MGSPAWSPGIFRYGSLDAEGDDLSRAPIAVVDVETSGLSPRRGARVLELAVVTVAAGKIVDEWQTLVDAGCDPGATHVHKIDAAQLQGAPSFADIVGDLLARLDGAVVAAHNATFEERFLQAELESAGAPLSVWPALCTMGFARRVLPGPGYKLADCCQAVGVTLREAHSALGDARATAEMLTRLRPELAHIRYQVGPPSSRSLPAPSGRVHLRRRPTSVAGGPPSASAKVKQVSVPAPRVDPQIRARVSAARARQAATPPSPDGTEVRPGRNGPAAASTPIPHPAADRTTLNRLVAQLAARSGRTYRDVRRSVDSYLGIDHPQDATAAQIRAGITFAAAQLDTLDRAANQGERH